MPAILISILYTLIAGVSAQLSVPGNSTFDAQINQILHWDGLRQSNIGLGPSAIAAAAMAIGVVITFFGFKLLRPAIFVAGFIIGAVAGFIGAETLLRTKPDLAIACWVAFLLGGLLCGFVLVYLHHIGIAALGAVAGALFATVLHTSCGYKLLPANPQIVLNVLLVVFSILFGILALVLERPFVIFAMSAFGAIMITWGVGFFAGGYPNATSLPQSLKNGTVSVDIPYSWWGYVVGTVVLCVLGTCYQMQATALPPKKRTASLFTLC
ncbi:hypothetical protein SDRG_15861 [Saprolegnia diclina VS20]|uniref:Transmembrane protein 198 n=1 Tax=Saprolegnia diclina (strain VS20) TaxID=1156394 RepID=T0PLK8_SAPDV|nr:hypothetical protein SDRG_15861 [Saprolegnia diclina VS20]EQC26274.1 hypothetical protein SDRG_15861 [Saprolegnia diclina VS20]|eukprot:XP_008620269.1 hypothetical protein SDRG_15861 [Saprolegnia diclina VS20]